MKKLNILVVEDGRPQRETLRDFLIKEDSGEILVFSDHGSGTTFEIILPTQRG